MASIDHNSQHRTSAAGNPLLPPAGDLLRIGLAALVSANGPCGTRGTHSCRRLATPGRLDRRQRATRSPGGDPVWLSGGPSQIDTWDPKPEAPTDIRGPYRTIPTSVPGIRMCEHLPLQARLMHKLSILPRGRLLREQPYPDHDAGRQSPGAPHR